MNEPRPTIVDRMIREVRDRRLAGNTRGEIVCPDCGARGGHNLAEFDHFECVACARCFPVVRDRDIQPSDRKWIGTNNGGRRR